LRARVHGSSFLRETLSELDVLVAEVERAGGEAVAVAGDVKDESLARELVEASVEHFGGLDVAFNNAGINGTLGPVTDLSLRDWRETLDTNLTSAFSARSTRYRPLWSGVEGQTSSPRASSATRSDSQVWRHTPPAKLELSA
jgi:NAD(P)-dependent dehydrogenase (short-subunit alcohol dehydrogenase family)